LDEAAVLESISKTKCAITAEEHQLNGGLGDSIAQLLSRKQPSPIEMVGINDSFGESGKPTELMEKYGLSTGDIFEAVLRVLERK
jgi:transketolase